MLKIKRYLVASPLIMLLAACQTTGANNASVDVSQPETAQTVIEVVPARTVLRTDVNPNYQPGQLLQPRKELMTLEEMMALDAGDEGAEELSNEDRLRLPAMRTAAMSFGARGGLAWATRRISELLENQASNLSRTFNFSSFLIQGPSGTKILPPVISESRETYEQFDAGRSLRIADTYYEIIEQARFTPIAPLWHNYLLRTYSAPELPNPALLPKSAAEREVWQNFVAQGFEEGVRQAQNIFRNDMRRLERDFTGMVRYAELLEKGLVSEPIVANANLGVTGTGEDMRINDRAMSITADPRLNVHSSPDWEAPVSGMTPGEASMPPR
ncbi:type IV secretory system conjugative DNA transfer family protein [Thalassospira xianhensis]|uniref:type IV secretory system conjugative DNA transfer family protein n=1 Tax=Thalassospira xianhensis TaxID=478503 RepID=UPI000DEDA0C5|nr:type IV secretory system conjugative DNA transfer family protein [Thalassospira xianhensis]